MYYEGSLAKFARSLAAREESMKALRNLTAE
jgi:hypothetical protein